MADRGKRGAGTLRGRGRARARARGTVTGFGRGDGQAPSTADNSLELPGEDIETVGVRRKALGTSGFAIKIHTNHFLCDIPDRLIYHYDGEWLFMLLPLYTNMLRDN